MAHQHVPRVVVMDIAMPGLKGPEEWLFIVEAAAA
jgi:CheY-like chemotaxis protein